ncbi:peroxisomal membrane protein 11B-like [Haliotis rubra]|uniref:peroxisomal membrane protein 11B-like n=1 Tax=Haliotis rubra TaxID=36100 RepID=UPI001EE58735|nr:peroxisomal membrane protein 11B-like [Haliotis rubra]
MADDSDFVGHLVKFNSLSSGRDKLARLVQYASKFAWWHLQKGHFDPNIINKFKNVDNALSTTRKVLRLGKSIDFLHSALRSIHISDTVLRLTITLSKINQACYLLFDHIIWAGRIGIAKVDSAKWKDLSARFWLVTIILNLIRDVYGMWTVIIEELRLRNKRASKSTYGNGDANHKYKTRRIPNDTEVVLSCFQESVPLILDFIRNMSDLVLPLAALKRINASAGVQGAVGVVSSVIGIITTWNPDLRLVPS